jgi:hypothetical protein
MSVSDDNLRGAVDEVLEAAWPDELRRARRRWNLGTLGRIAGGLFGFCGILLIAQLILGFRFPWAFCALIGGLTVSAAVGEARDPDHLRHDRP